MQIFTRRRWSGGQHLAGPGGAIVVANHLSNFDPLVVAHFCHDNGRPPRFLAKKQIFDVPLLGSLIRAAGQIPVDRGTSRAAHSLSIAEQALAAGETAVIFPEGTLTYDPDLWPMTAATGAARLALTTGVPVIPVAQWGSQNVIPRWSKGLKLIPPQVMYVKAGPAVDLSDLLGQPFGNALLQDATTRIMDAITGLLAEIREATPPTERWDRRTESDANTPSRDN